MSELQRITVEYIESEDRFRLIGEIQTRDAHDETSDSPDADKVDEGDKIDQSDKRDQSDESDHAETVTLWVTQRLLLRLLPLLFEWLQQLSPEAIKNPSRDTQANKLLQGFAQQAAAEQIPQQRPVQSQADTPSWLVNEVDIVRPAAWVKLIFKGHNGEQASFTLEGKQLRQWLSIVHNSWIQAEWPTTIWPAWIHEAEPATETETESGKALH
jgi:hypothetical protein